MGTLPNNARSNMPYRNAIRFNTAINVRRMTHRRSIWAHRRKTFLLAAHSPNNVATYATRTPQPSYDMSPTKFFFDVSRWVLYFRFRTQLGIYRNRLKTQRRIISDDVLTTMVLDIAEIISNRRYNTCDGPGRSKPEYL